jgi:hypothetical protein
MENFVEYSRDRKENQIGLVLKRQANQYLLVIPMDKIISTSTDDIPCLKFDPVMPDTVPTKENKIAIHSSQIIRIVGVKLKSYFDHGKILYHKDMNIFCVQDNNLVTTGKYARYFTCSRLDGNFNHISADTFMDRYIEKSNIICICYKALSCTRRKAFLTIAIPLISDSLFHEIRMAYPNDGFVNLYEDKTETISLRTVNGIHCGKTGIVSKVLQITSLAPLSVLTSIFNEEMAWSAMAKYQKGSFDLLAHGGIEYARLADPTLQQHPMILK